jgi:hypothetical protein
VIPVPIEVEAGWSSGPIMTCLEMRISPTGNRPPVRPTVAWSLYRRDASACLTLGLCKHINVCCSVVSIVGDRCLPLKEEILLFAYYNISLTLHCSYELSLNCHIIQLQITR